MHIHYFQHNHFEDLGYIGEWAGSNSFTTSVTRFDLKPDLPSLHDFDWLVVMGGAMGVNDSGRYPWIQEEVQFIKKAILSGKIVLGICLGSQLIAKALGANVFKNQIPEIGFWPVHLSNEAQQDEVFKHFPSKFEVMHFHFDTFDLPEGALAMAKSEVTAVQAFRYGKTVFALQFHPELTESNLPFFIRELSSEIVQSPMVQNQLEILQKSVYCRFGNEILRKVLDAILQLV